LYTKKLALLRKAEGSLTPPPNFFVYKKIRRGGEGSGSKNKKQAASYCKFTLAFACNVNFFYKAKGLNLRRRAEEMGLATLLFIIIYPLL
jgi:hypothetical protein